MPIAYHLSGPAEIRVGTGSGGALEKLGYSRDGAVCRDESAWQDIFADQNGGERGHPVETILLSQRSLLRIELAKWDQGIIDKLLTWLRATAFTPALVAGVPAPVGLVVLGNEAATRLVILGVEPRNYPCATLTKAVEINKGSRSSRLATEWQCLRDPISTSPTYGVLYNAATT
jgi:hypothetical protein